MTGYFTSDVTEEQIKRERAKARELRQSAWWKRKRSHGVCFYCRRSLPPAELTMDHIVPLVRGGKSVKSNLVPVCKECNNQKKHMLPLEWEDYLKTLAREESDL